MLVHSEISLAPLAQLRWLVRTARIHKRRLPLFAVRKESSWDRISTGASRGSRFLISSSKVPYGFDVAVDERRQRTEALAHQPSHQLLFQHQRVHAHERKLKQVET